MGITNFAQFDGTGTYRSPIDFAIPICTRQQSSFSSWSISLHPTLPSPYFIFDLGEEARRLGRRERPANAVLERCIRNPTIPQAHHHNTRGFPLRLSNVQTSLLHLRLTGRIHEHIWPAVHSSRYVYRSGRHEKQVRASPYVLLWYPLHQVTNLLTRGRWMCTVLLYFLRAEYELAPSSRPMVIGQSSLPSGWLPTASSSNFDHVPTTRVNQRRWWTGRERGWARVQSMCCGHTIG